MAWLRQRPLHVGLPAEFGPVRVVHAGLQPGTALAAQLRDQMITIRSLLPNGTGTSAMGDGDSWAAAWRGPEHLVFGHDARRRIQRYDVISHPPRALECRCCKSLGPNLYLDLGERRAAVFDLL